MDGALFHPSDRTRAQGDYHPRRPTPADPLFRCVHTIPASAYPAIGLKTARDTA